MTVRFYIEASAVTIIVFSKNWMFPVQSVRFSQCWKFLLVN